MTHALQPPATNDASQLWCQCGVIHHDGDGEGGCSGGEAAVSHSLQTVATLRMIDRVAHIKKVIVLMTYFLLSDH